MIKKYSIKKQMANDYSTLLCFIAFIIISLFLIGIYGNSTLDTDMKILLGIGFGILDILCIIGFILRIEKGKYFVKNGIETEAEIVYVSYYKDRGRIEYIYKIDNKEFKCGNGAHISKTTKEYAERDKIIILVDPKNKKKAVILKNFIME
jgi:hypothetical protein